MADICLADSITIDPTFLSGLPTASSSTSQWIHIHQDCPNEAGWRLWRQACQHWSLNGKLHFPLGPWLPPGDKLCRSWPAYYDYSNGELYIRNDAGFLRCIATDPIQFSPILQDQWQPTHDSYPIQARLTIAEDAWIAIIPNRLPAPTTASAPVATFADFLQTLDEWESELFAELTMHVDCYELIWLVETQ
jgi:hypothetical protein